MHHYIQHNSENNDKGGTLKLPRGMLSSLPNGFYTTTSPVCYEYEYVMIMFSICGYVKAISPKYHNIVAMLFIFI